MNLTWMILFITFIILISLCLVFLFNRKNILSKTFLNSPKNYREISESYRQLEDFEQAKSSFITLVVNEMRSPLTTIKGFAMTLLLKDKLINDLKRKEYLKIVDVETDRLMRTVEKLINISQMESGKIPASWKSINLINLIKRVLNKLETKAKKVQFNLDFSSDFPEMQGDEDKLEEAITTLVEICMDLINLYGIVSITGAAMDRKAKINIAIEAENFPPEQIYSIIKNLTHPETSGNKPFLPDPKLSLAKAIIEIHRGSISVESKSAKNLSIDFTLPI